MAAPVVAAAARGGATMSSDSNPCPTGVSAAARRRVLAIAVGAGVLAAGAILAVHADQEDGAVGPDVVVFSFTDIGNYGSSDGFVGYALGTRSCNRGDQPLNWCNDGGQSGCGMSTTDEDHPVIAQNLYRLKDDRFEQIGMSWLKHGFLSTNSNTQGCSGAQGQSCTTPPLFSDQLGIGCTDPYGSSLNGSRPLGRRSEVDATTGAFPYPPSSPGGPYEVYDQRIKVSTMDVDSTFNPDALYFVEGQYIAPDDAAADNALNNASYRRVTIGGGPNYSLSMTGSFFEQQPAIYAWQAQDPEVDLVAVDIPGSSPVERFHVARRVTDLGGGDWHYEYAIHNLNSDRSAISFTVDFPGAATIGNAGFHDVDHHSGEPYDTADWTVDLTTPGQVTWSGVEFATDPDANALRWATMFSFWFDATAGPSGVFHTLELFKPGSPAAVEFYVTREIFNDGFESGDTSAWSSTVGKN